MKALIIFFLAVVVSAAAFSKNNLGNSVNNNSLVIKKPVYAQDTVPVPYAIRQSFETKYPKSSRVMWYKYSPGTTKAEPGMWYSTMDENDYYVTYNWNDADYVSWYDNGTWIRSATTIDDSELPTSVSNAINSEFPGFVVTDVELDNEKGQTLYEVRLAKGDKRWKVHYNAAGAVLKKKPKDLTKTTAANAVVTDFQTRYPGATAVSWYAYSPYDDTYEMVATDWEYTMHDPNDLQVNYTLDGVDYVAFYDNGSWLRSESMTYNSNKLPGAVSNAINAQYAGYSIKDVDREDRSSGVVYEVELAKGNDRCKLHYSADGNLVSKKCRTM